MAAQSALNPAPAGRGLTRRLVAVAVLVLLIAVAASWLAITKTAGPSTLAAAGEIRKDQTTALAAVLSRSGYITDGLEAQVTLATPDFFRISGRMEDGRTLGTDRGLVFVANEVVHYGDLPATLAVALRMDGGPVLQASERQILADSTHHRTTALVFAAVPPSALAGAHTFELVVGSAPGIPLTWKTPFTYPDVVQGGGFDWRLVLPLAIGLLATLSPCLLQLTAFYLPTIAGLTIGQGGEIDRRRIIPFAALFVLGFTIPYTLGGAVMGAVGGAAAVSGWLNPQGPIAIGAGLLMIGMAVVVARQARAPLVCNMPMPSAITKSRRAPYIEAFVSGFAIAFGCLACFGGAVLGVLIVYTGILGSPLLGASAMFLFSMGIAIPFLLAAFGLSRVRGLIEVAQRATPAIGLVMALVMAFFGATMVTGNFHVVSGWLVQHLPLL